MSTTKFNRDSMAGWYAREHLKTDSGLVCIYYLPGNSPDQEIRLIEINKLMGDRTDTALEPINFGIDMGTENEHKLLVLDVTPDQWDRVVNNQLCLPEDWSLEDAKKFSDE